MPLRGYIANEANKLKVPKKSQLRWEENLNDGMGGHLEARVIITVDSEERNGEQMETFLI